MERIPFGLTTKNCRRMCLRQISNLRIEGEPLVEALMKHNQESTQPLECDIDHYAQILADLLQQMLDLLHIFVETDKWHWVLHQIIGKAFLLLPGPLKLHHIVGPRKQAPLPPDFISPLAFAIAEGRLPFLRSLDMLNVGEYEDYLCSWQSRNFDCLSTAIERGYLSHLTIIQLEGGEAVNYVEQAFRQRFLLEQQTIVPMEALFLKLTWTTLSSIIAKGRNVAGDACRSFCLSLCLVTWGPCNLIASMMNIILMSNLQC